MKTGIHPDYQETKVACGCGNSFVTRSTLKEIKVEICNACHPYYTGNQKLIDTAGRVEKFNARFARTQVLQADKAVPKKKKS